MKKLSVSLKESRFVDLIDKKFTGEIRKEDIIGNLQRLEPVDIGTSVLWADDDLCVDDKYLFTFDDVTNMLKDSKWRLPTVSEVEELKQYNKDVKDGKYIFTKNGTSNETSLTFYPHGYIYVLSQSKITAQGDNNVILGWINDVHEYNNNYISISIYSMARGSFVIDKDNAIYKNSLLSARLVKDK